jgi:Peptidase family M1 domain
VSKRSLACPLCIGLVLIACNNPLAVLPFGGLVVSVPTAVRDPQSTPVTEVQDLAVYQPALRPESVADVALVPAATRYFIDLTLRPGDLPTLTGLEHVHYTNNEAVALDTLVFRLYPNLPDFGGSMEVSEVAVSGTPVKPTFDSRRSAMQVPLRPSLAPGASVDVALQYSAQLPTDTESGYAVFAFADGVYAMAGLYPTVPVYDHAGWNVEVSPPYGDVTFTDTSFYQVHLTAPAELVVVTSGNVVERRDHGDGTRTWTAVGGPIRDFYIAASDDYQSVSSEVEGTQINAYYRTGQEEGGQLALRYASAALRLFDDRFGPYPYAELDIVPTPTNAGGVEYPGAIAVSQSLYEEGSGYFELVVAHEVAHQWWYGLVGSDQADHPWLDEALANYSMYLYYEMTADPESAERIKETSFEEPYRELQQQHMDRGVGGAVSSFRDQSDYVSVVYAKGPLFFDAVRTQIGDAAFFAALRSYLSQHRYRIAYPRDLVTAFEEASGQQIDVLYETWIVGKQP